MRKIKTTKIGQKDYVDVSERIMSFWELHSDWSIITSIEQVDLETGVVIIKAWVEDEKGKVRSTGHAHEFQADKKSKVNMTSFVENCETSAIGRALGTKGIGTGFSTSIPVSICFKCLSKNRNMAAPTIGCCGSLFLRQGLILARAP